MIAECDPRAHSLIGVTGHRTLSDITCQLVFDAVKNELRSIRRPTVVTSLAAGADQLCAEAALEIGGHLSVIIPARNYVSSFASDIDLEKYGTADVVQYARSVGRRVVVIWPRGSARG